DVEHMFVEKQQRAFGLILRGSRDAPLHRQERQERFHLPISHLAWMPLAVKMDVAPDPIDVGLFSTQAVVLAADAVAHAVEKTWRRRIVGGAIALIHLRQTFGSPIGLSSWS